jgi:predicted nucleic acid-binding protein
MFWDSSALVSWLLPERLSAQITPLLVSDQRLTIWWGTPVECLSAIYRRHRLSPLPDRLLAEAIDRSRKLAETARTVATSEEVRSRAARLLAVHSLRAADALQLAAALVFSGGQPAGETFVCLDQTLREAAVREGFAILP